MCYFDSKMFIYYIKDSIVYAEWIKDENRKHIIEDNAGGFNEIYIIW